MATLLEQIIEGSCDSQVQTPDLLRKVQIAATRIGAQAVRQWAQQELQGYAAHDKIPAYRILTTPVVGVFSGPMQSEVRRSLPPHPDFERDFQVELYQPLLTIQAFTESKDPLKREWPAWQVKKYSDSGNLSISFHILITAWNIITQQELLGIVDIVRSKAMEFALDLQTNFPNAGSLEGPTLDNNTAVAPVIFNITNNIYGHGANIATGFDVTQKSTFRGNVDELTKQIKILGISDPDTFEFIKIIQDENSVDTPRLKSFFDKIRSGAVHVGSTVASEVIIGSLIELGKMFLGIA